MHSNSRNYVLITALTLGILLITSQCISFTESPTPAQVSTAVSTAIQPNPTPIAPPPGGACRVSICSGFLPLLIIVSKQLSRKYQIFQ